MQIGVSTASLYPMHTEDALLKLAETGVKNAEIFLNSTKELEGGIFSAIKAVVRDYGMNVMSAHPFSSPMETLFLFSSYDRRVDEMLDMYKRYFAAMTELGARIFVVHGAISSAKCGDGVYMERLSALIGAGREYGVTVAQENVSYCKSGSLSFLETLSREMGGEIKFVLDIKQALRAGYTAFDVLDGIGDKLIHLHLSDSDGEYDCLPPGTGDFDFAGFFGKLKASGYSGGAAVELYRSGYGDYTELAVCVRKLEEIYHNL
ncbi:MAG: sugar phosphate isomerase/epimerase [Oscillospiraceae bacterium]|jgi:sugar phosphate isomerase/epimerase|nr:sugar phosphate isomerase/epimerase [Oscillospiraceae bacterium]